MTTFKSELFPIMDTFLGRLQKALENLPDNPKPECKGFCIAEYNLQQKLFRAETIGEVPDEKKYTYLHFATKKATQCLLFNKKRSKDFADDALEQYQGGINISIDSYMACVATSGHKGIIDEAMSILWAIAKLLIWKRGHPYIESFVFWEEYLEYAIIVEKNYFPDNTWITIMAKLMVDN